MNIKRLISLTLAVVIVLSACAALYGCSSSEGDKDLKYAKSKVEDFVEWQTKYNAEFYDEVYSKAYLAALSFTPEKTGEDLQKLARYLYVDSITVTDADGKIIADYPSENKGKNINDIDEYVKYMGILKWVCPQCATDVVKNKDGEYEMTLGVQRSDDGGCVIVSLKTDAYAKVDGSKLADECGRNVIVAKDKTVISSTLKDVDEGMTFKELKISDNDLKANDFILSVGKDSYTAKSAEADEYTVIVCE